MYLPIYIYVQQNHSFRCAYAAIYVHGEKNFVLIIKKREKPEKIKIGYVVRS